MRDAIECLTSFPDVGQLALHLTGSSALKRTSTTFTQDDGSPCHASAPRRCFREESHKATSAFAGSWVVSVERPCPLLGSFLALRG